MTERNPNKDAFDEAVAAFCRGEIGPVQLTNVTHDTGHTDREMWDAVHGYYPDRVGTAAGWTFGRIVAVAFVLVVIVMVVSLVGMVLA